jgi:hypothetical protein
MGRYLDIIRQVEEAHSSNAPEHPPIGDAKTATAEVFIGSTINWQAADLTVRRGTIDFLHTDSDGRRWAFVTFPGGGWSAVNLKYARRSDAL